MRRTHIARIVVAIFFVGSLTTFCTTEVAPVNDNESYDKASYTLEITPGDGAGVSDGTKLVYGKTIECTWDDEIGIVWLGTDRDSVPIATITFKVGAVTKKSPDYDYVDAIGLAISTTDRRTGTSEQLNAKTYRADEALIIDLKRGGNYVTGTILAKLVEINTSEKANAKCRFVAVSN